MVLFAEVIALKDDLKSAIKEARHLRSNNDELCITDLIDDVKSIEKKAWLLKNDTLKSDLNSLIILFIGAVSIGLCLGFYSAYIKSEELFLRELRHSQVSKLEKEYFNLRNLEGEKLLLINSLQDMGVIISRDYILVPNQISDGTGFLSKENMSIIWLNSN